MLMRFPVPVFIVLVGCGEFPPEGEPVEVVSLLDNTEVELATAQVTWGETGIVLELTNNNGMDIQGFGIAQNDATCQSQEGSIDTSNLGCWTGEDCIGGDVSLDESTGFAVCHTVGTRSELYLDYVDNGIYRSIVDKENIVVNGQSTAFPDSSYEFKVTYYLLEADGRCWRWGLETAYYADQGCSNAN